MWVRVVHNEEVVVRYNLFHKQFSRLKETFKNSPGINVKIETQGETLKWEQSKK